MFVMNIWSLPAKLKVLSFAWIAVVDVIPGEIELEVMVGENCVAMAGLLALLGINSSAREQQTPVIVIVNTFLSLG